ncbi:hypothetical protein TNCV_2269091 [Trichonephila clavipes]|nr:hypothetical protein TNCV_2269091 [Trichonephila clavipes]
MTVRCRSQGAVLSLVVCQGRKIDGVASEVRHVSEEVTSSRLGYFDVCLCCIAPNRASVAQNWSQNGRVEVLYYRDTYYDSG